MANRNINIRFDASMDISQIKQATVQMQQALSKVNFSLGNKNKFKNLLENLDKEIEDFSTKANKEIHNTSELNALQKSANKVFETYKKIQIELESIGELSGTDFLKAFSSDSIQKVEKAKKALSDFNKNAEKTKAAINKQNKSLKDAEQKVDNYKNSIEALEKITRVSNKTYSKYGDNLGKASEAVTANRIRKDNAEIAIDKAKKEGAPTTVKGELNKKFKQNKELLNELTIAEKKYENAQKAQKKYEELLQNTISISKYNSEHKRLAGQLDKTTKEIEEAKQALNELQTSGNTDAFEKLKKTLSEITGLDYSNIQNTADGIEKLQNEIRNIESNEINKLETEMSEFKQEVDNTDEAIQGTKTTLKQFGQSVEDIDRTTRDIDDLKNSMLAFFSISNTIEIFKRTVRQAYQTVTELDKAMTDTAVVTDFTVSDMWEALPRYTDAANELGTTTLGAYETMTLFYQQGLKTNEVFEIGTETMKMARIADMDYTKATDLMTAALRGFNMELNEVSAQRINDVYSELAAITAASTEEIADAMTRTASIANSAGMAFETTSAFLSQMIETTREAPENLGTAMKTIIARFQELKKAPEEIGEIDGEIIDANKIDTALKTIGVSLMDTNGQFRDLDEVFLEISKKWDTLDKNTQRYIATTAAGSRQQSRFIAMMSDYERTMELVEAANDSAGASEEQFGKTVDSLESKINKLKNAWNEFTVGIANSNILKGGIDLLTSLLNTVNNLTGSVGSFTGSLSRIITVFAALKVGKTLFQNISATAPDIKAGLKDAVENGRVGDFFSDVFNKQLKKSKLQFGKLFENNDVNYQKQINNYASKYAGNFIKTISNVFEKAGASLQGDIVIEKELKEIESALKKGEITAQQAVQRINNKLREIGRVEVDTATLTRELQEVDNILNSPEQRKSQRYQSIAMGAMVAGGAMMSFAEKTGEAEAAVSGLGQGLITAGTSFTSLFAILNPILGGLSGFLPGLAIASVAIGAISGALNGLEKQREKEKEQNEELIAQGKELASTYESQTDALKQYQEASKAYSTGEITKDELLTTTSSLIEQYELEDKRLENLKQGYSDLNQVILQNIRSKLDEQRVDAEKATEAAAEEYSINTKKISSDIVIDYNAGLNDKGIDKQITDTIKNANRKYTVTPTEQDYTSLYLKEEEIEDPTKRIEAYSEIKEIVLELEKTYKREELEANASYKQLVEWEDELSKGADEYLDALELERKLKLEILDIDNELSNNTIKKSEISNRQDFEQYRNKLVADASQQGISEEDVSSYLSSDPLTSQFENNYQLKIDLISEYKGEGDLLSYLNAIEDAGKFSYVYSLELDTVAAMQSLEEFDNKLQQIIEEQKYSVAETLASSTSNVLNALASDEGLASLETEQLQEFNSTLGMIPGLYNEARTAYQEWIDITNSGAGTFAQVSYLNDLLQQSNEILTGVPDTIDGINAAYQDANVTIEGSAIRVDKLVQLTDSLIAQSEIASEAVGLISKNYTIDPKNLETVLNTFPQLAQNAQVLADGTVELNKEVAKSVLGDMEAIVSGDGAKTEAMLDNEIALAQAAVDKATTTYKAAVAAAGNEVKMQEVIAGANVDAQMAIAEALYGTEAVAEVTGSEMQNSEIDIAEEGRITGQSIGENISAGAENAAKNVNTFARAMVKDLYAVGQQGENTNKAIAGKENAINYSGSVNTSIGAYKKTETVVETREYRDIEELKSSVVKDNEEKIFDFSGLKDITDQEWAAVINQLANNKTQAEETLADLIIAKSKIVSSIDSIELGSGLEDTTDTMKESEEETEKWVNSYDKLYNLVRKINKALRMREKYERDYQRAVEDSGKSTEDLLKNLNKQENKLKQIIQREQTLIKERKTEATTAEKSTIFGNTKYSYYATYDDKNNIVNINWDRINKVKNEETGQKIEDYISKLESIQDEIEDANDTIEDSRDILKELETEGRDEYLDLEQRVFDALVQKQQDQIDALSQIDESINDANQSLIDSIQSNLSKIRQERDNQKTEDDIAENERRLAYLRRDTSNANQKEIKQLEEEIAQSKEDYTDSLIDQKISELQEQNDAAAEQRQQQIDLLQAQLDTDVENGKFWPEVKTLIEEGTSVTGGLLKGSELEALLQSAEGWQGMSETQRTVWVEDLKETIKQALVYQERQEGTNPLAAPQKGMSLEDMIANNFISAGQNVKVQTDTAGKVTGEVKSNGTVFNEGKTGDNVTFTYSGLTWTGEMSNGMYVFDKNNTTRKEEPKTDDGGTNGTTITGETKQTYDKYGLANYSGTLGPGFTIFGEKVKQLQQALKNLGYSLKVDGEYGPETVAAVKAYQRTRNSKNNAGLVVDGIAGPKTLATFAKMAYKKGGLADFTGPAWLDGTKSKPELVLNAKDTQNFIQLKDILAKLLGGSYTSSGNNGDSYYEIHIEVDELSNDYDVEQLASKVKRMINEDARYRNVNAISLLR